MENAPSYDGSGLVNLVAELERRMTGGSALPGLSRSGAIPDADTYVLALFDGLGVAQMEHTGARVFRETWRSTLEAPFPTMTNVSLATLSTGLPGSQHGQVAHLTWYPELEMVVNSLKWVTLGGDPVEYDYEALLPEPNFWERLRHGGVEPITVQPGAFQGSPLSMEMYRGARFEGAWDAPDLAEATLALAGEPRRLIFVYIPFVDFAGHVFGQGSDEFAESMTLTASIWQSLVDGLPPEVGLIGTADHGLAEITEEGKIPVRDPAFRPLRFAGDPRGVQLWGDRSLMDMLAEFTGGTLADAIGLVGPDISAQARSRLGEKVLLAPPGRVILPKGFDKRLRCYHGGLSQEEVEIPLLVR